MSIANGPDRDKKIKLHYESDYKCDAFYVYGLKCCGGNPPYYIGQTGHLIGRLMDHIIGNGKGFTAKYPPCKLVHLEIFPNRKEAIRREVGLVWKTRKKIFNFSIPDEFDEFFYRIAAMASRDDKDLLAPLEYSKAIRDGCNDFIEMPIVLEWEEKKNLWKCKENNIPRIIT